MIKFPSSDAVANILLPTVGSTLVLHSLSNTNVTDSEIGDLCLKVNPTLNITFGPNRGTSLNAR